MRIDPAIAAMRRDPSLQRRAQSAMIAAATDWWAEPERAALQRDLQAYSQGSPLDALGALAAPFTKRAAAAELVESFCLRFASALAVERFGQMPFRHGFDGTVATLLLARVGRAHLVLQSREPGQWSYRSVSFSDGERHEAVVAGNATARIVEARTDTATGSLAATSLTLASGSQVTLDLRRQTLQIEAVSHRLVTLRLHRFAERPGPARELALPDGDLLHRAAGDMRSSRLEMMVALLGRMGTAGAAEEIAVIAVEPGDDSLRWQALRECLALDTGIGFQALLKVARDDGDPLARSAGALRAQLVESHPQLLALEGETCRA
jgi:hypothetical protein